METHETSTVLSKGIFWFKANILIIIIFSILVIFVVNKLDKFESLINESTIMPSVILDFQNNSGAARIKSSFTDILVASEGSIKKGDGYEVKLNIINPSSITLKSIRCEFNYRSSNNPVIYEDINISIPPGSSKMVKCFISDLSDYDLKAIDVSVYFNQISFYQK